MRNNHTVKIKCPHCGWVRDLNLEVIQSEEADIITELGDNLRHITDDLRSTLASSPLDTGNAWIDLPACPHCDHEYRYNINTGEVIL
ncbi:MAG: hypothetical protein JXA33_06100 [Anaerolineae bacterium]|nr:hypothetical protein [Anaerolineae bacterium]